MSQTTLNEAMAALTAGILEDTTLEDGKHPTVDELLAYQAGELGDAAAHGRLQEHLAWCSACAETVVDLASWPDVELRDPDLERTVAEEGEDWQAIQRRFGQSDNVHDDTASDDTASDDTASDDTASDDTASDVPPPAPFQPPRPAVDLPPPVPRRSYGPIHLLAAALFLAVVGLSVQVARLSSPPAAMGTPVANLFVVDLEPVGVAATRNDIQGTDVPAGMGTVVFLLVQEDLRPFDDHAVELRGEDGEIFWQAGGLVSPPEGGFSVAVPLADLPSDALEIRLYGVAGGQRELLATYRTRIERATF